MIYLRGITWSHRRAVDPLIATLPAFRRRHPEVEIAWEQRPLHGFEFTPVDRLAEGYDFIILDHPFCGEIAASGCLRPLDDLLTPELSAGFVGPSLASYRYRERLWALPVDAACQVAVARPDLLQRLDRPAPASWPEMMELGARARAQGTYLAIALQGVHSLMTFFTLCANLGRPCGAHSDGPFVDHDAGRRALAALHQLLAFCPPEALDWNSIALHDAMVARDDLVFCPAVYCYATYAEADIRRPLRFFDLPGLESASPRGSTLGGTGLGVSARTSEPAALAYAAFLMEAATQKAFATHHGQPARREAWEDAAVDARFAGCFHATRATMEQAWIRPRHAGYLAFQARGGELVEAHLRGRIAAEALLDRLDALHVECAAVAPKQ
jgi:multiple sugar transport system substrate-binding protein